MSNIPPPTDPVEALGEAYELLLEKVLDDLHIADPHHAVETDLMARIQAAREAIPALAGLEEAHREAVEKAVARDVHSLLRFRRAGGEQVEKWLGIDTDLLPNRLRKPLPRFFAVPPPGVVDMAVEHAFNTYHAGELTGPGTLVCDQCGEKLRFEKPDRIPPCPKCGGTVFHRPSDA